MCFHDLLGISRWKLNALALIFLFTSLLGAAWRHRRRGVVGFLLFLIWLPGYYILQIAALSLLNWRIQVILSAYAWFRRIDDIMDDDNRPPKPLTREQYLAEKEAILLSSTTPEADRPLARREDALLAFVLTETKRQGIDVTQELLDLWSVMKWDDVRYRQSTLVGRKEMAYYASLQDLSILSFCVKVGGGDQERFEVLATKLTGLFTRTDWLSDIEGDMEKGVVNIPVEAVERHGLDLALIRRDGADSRVWSTPGFIPWYRTEIETMESQWSAFKTSLNGDFGGVFRSKLTTFVFQSLIVGHFEREFRAAVRKLINVK